LSVDFFQYKTVIVQECRGWHTVSIETRQDVVEKDGILARLTMKSMSENVGEFGGIHLGGNRRFRWLVVSKNLRWVGFRKIIMWSVAAVAVPRPLKIIGIFGGCCNSIPTARARAVIIPVNSFFIIKLLSQKLFRYKEGSPMVEPSGNPIKRLASTGRVVLARRTAHPTWTEVVHFSVDGIEVLTYQAEKPCEMFITSTRKPIGLYSRHFRFDKLPEFKPCFFLLRCLTEQIGVSRQLYFVLQGTTGRC
jgi:hypothetical protein